MRLRIWTDSNANVHSKNERCFDTEDLGYSEKEWNRLDESDKWNAIEDFVHESGMLEYGFEEESK